MNDLRTLDIPKITDGEKFEYLIRAIYRNSPKYEFVELNGRSGQSQQGVDIFAREKDTGEWIGIQCKCRAKGKKLSQTEIEFEIENAKNFNPQISTLYIYTTCDRDVKTQEIVRKINTRRIKDKAFKIKMKFWSDIEESLKDDANYSVYYRFYSKFFADNLTLGHAVLKLFNLELHFDNTPDTHYDVMLGKIPIYKNNSHNGADYHRGTYFIVNLLHNRAETFHLPCFDSDIAQAFPNKIDRHRIFKWINTLPNIEEFIASEEDTFVYSLSTEERLALMENNEEYE